MSRIEHLIGPPTQRADEEAARDAVHALYVLRSIDDEEARNWAVDELGEYRYEIQRAILLAVRTDRSNSVRLSATRGLTPVWWRGETMRLVISV
jgi:hypothetical protein